LTQREKTDFYCLAGYFIWLKASLVIFNWSIGHLIRTSLGLFET